MRILSFIRAQRLSFIEALIFVDSRRVSSYNIPIMISFNIKELLPKDWQKLLKPYFSSNNYHLLEHFIRNEYSSSIKTIYPIKNDIFKAFQLIPVSRVKVVIIGQDPYHDKGQAEGLSFSVPSDCKVPPSLKNIYKEIEKDISVKKDFTDGNLVNWANQGVFLLNSILTVEENKPSSHKNRGWESFTNTVIERLSNEKDNLVFLLWGNYAKSKRHLIDSKRHLILEAAHPSPFSAYNGFFGCKHFSKTNKYLKKYNLKEIAW